MKALDSLLLTLLVWGAYSGFRKGFVVEVFSMGSFLVATIGSIRLLDQLAGLCVRWYGHIGGIMPYVIFTLLFITIVVVVTLLGWLFRRLINLTLLGGLDKVMGGLLGIFKWAFFLSTFLWLASVLHLKIPDTYTADTLLFPIIEPIAPQFVAWLVTWFPAIQAWLSGINAPAGN